MFAKAKMLREWKRASPTSGRCTHMHTLILCIIFDRPILSVVTIRIHAVQNLYFYQIKILFGEHAVIAVSFAAKNTETRRRLQFPDL